MALEARLVAHGATLADAKISLRNRHGALFVLREGTLAVLAFPVAMLGRVTHWLPIRIARAFALRSLDQDPSRDQPAMLTIVVGTGLVLAWYVLQAALVTHWFGSVPALLWVATIFVAAQVDLLFSDRLDRARRRARTYLALRGNTALQASVVAEIDGLMAEATMLEQRLVSLAPGL